jgi:hypothetical protein
MRKSIIYAFYKTNNEDTEAVLQKRIYELEQTIEFMKDFKKDHGNT